MPIRTCTIAVGLVLPAFRPAWSQDLPDGPGKDVVVKRCTSCHEAALFTSLKHTRPEWKAVVETMMGYGSEITRSEVEVVADYLAKNYGADSSPAKP